MTGEGGGRERDVGVAHALAHKCKPENNFVEFLLSPYTFICVLVFKLMFRTNVLLLAEISDYILPSKEA